jgi:nucleoside-diphosphate-sugar epimerase
MNIFVTGATGWVGAAVVRDLLEAGHKVLGLARSEAAAHSLVAVGATVHRGDIDDLESVRSGAANADGVIHTAFNHDFSQFPASCEHDRRVIESLGSALAGSDRPLVITSAIGALPPGDLATETTMPAGNPRGASEQAADMVRASGVRVSVVRLAPSVHGEGDHAFVPILIRIARETGVAAYPGEGLNRWTAVHRSDAARLFRLALESGVAGARYHGVAEEQVPFRDIARVIGRRLGLPIESRPPEHFGWFAKFAAMDRPASSQWTQSQLEWQPRMPGLLADLDQPYYFKQ